ncbi:MAG: UxaA family hydrolase [Proteobacteria bacterium]|nr:UxaA family hydrolase [Pseudomonadota bacterium]
MNINCGDIISGDVSLADNEQEIYREILRVASGGSTKARNWGLEWSNSCHGKWGR